MNLDHSSSTVSSMSAHWKHFGEGNGETGTHIGTPCMNVRVFILTGLAVFVLCPLTAYGCFCSAPPSKEEQEKMVSAPVDPEFKRWWREEFKGAVFIGTVIRIQKVDVKWFDRTTRMKRVTVNVERAWFGVTQQTFVIYTSMGKGGDCGVPYSKGYKYFFDAQLIGGQLSTNICSLTDPDNYKVKLFEKTFGDGRSFLGTTPH